MWESSRMMLPEHVQAIVNHHKHERIKARPILDDQRKEELDRLLTQAVTAQLNVCVKIHRHGKEQTLTGKAISVDYTRTRLKLQHDEHNFTWIFLSDLLHISLQPF